MYNFDPNYLEKFVKTFEQLGSDIKKLDLGLDLVRVSTF